MKKYIQYNKTTGRIKAVTSGKILKDKDGNIYQLAASVSDDMPILQVEVNDNIDLEDKKIDIATGNIIDRPITPWRAFEKEWSLQKVVKHLITSEGTRLTLQTAIKDLRAEMIED